MMTQAHFWTECGSNEVVAGDVVASQNQECDKCCESSDCIVYKCHHEGGKPMGLEQGMVRAIVILTGTLALQGGWRAQTENPVSGSQNEMETDAAAEAIDLYEETGLPPDQEREMEWNLLEATYRANRMGSWRSYEIQWYPEMQERGELYGTYLVVTLPLAQDLYFMVYNEDEADYTAYFAPEGGMDVPHEIPDSFWEDTGEEIQDTDTLLRDLNKYLLDRLFVELNNCREIGNYDELGAYRIRDYSVTNRYWTDQIIGTDIVFHVVPEAERAEDLEYFQGVLARAGLTDMESIKELMADLQVPGEDEWRSVPHPEDAIAEGIIPSTWESSPRMEEVIGKLAEMLLEAGHSSEEADAIAHTIMSRYYNACAKWLTQEKEYSFCFRTQLNEDGVPVSIMLDRTGGARWTNYTPHLKTKAEQQEAYFQAGYDEMDGMIKVMFW